MPPFHVMLKPRGPICNLDCAYCFYLKKEQLYPGADFRMTPALLEDFTSQALERQRKVSPLGMVIRLNPKIKISILQIIPLLILIMGYFIMRGARILQSPTQTEVLYVGQEKSASDSEKPTQRSKLLSQ